MQSRHAPRHCDPSEPRIPQDTHTIQSHSWPLAPLLEAEDGAKLQRARWRCGRGRRARAPVRWVCGWELNTRQYTYNESRPQNKAAKSKPNKPNKQKTKTEYQTKTNKKDTAKAIHNALRSKVWAGGGRKTMSADGGGRGHVTHKCGSLVCVRSTWLGHHTLRESQTASSIPWRIRYLHPQHRLRQ